MTDACKMTIKYLFVWNIQLIWNFIFEIFFMTNCNFLFAGRISYKLKIVADLDPNVGIF